MAHLEFPSVPLVKIITSLLAPVWIMDAKGQTDNVERSMMQLV